MDETKKINIATTNNISYSTINEDPKSKNDLENSFAYYNYNNNFNSNQIQNNLNFKKIPESLANDADVLENTLINQILNTYGYKPKMLALILSCFFGNYVNSYAIYNVSTNVLMLQSLFGSYSANIESVLSMIAFGSKIFGCLTVSFWAQKMLRSTIVLASIAAILAATLLIIIKFGFYSYCIFLVIGGYFAGLLEPITIDNLCETLPIRYRGYFLFFMQSGFSVFQIVGFLVLSWNSSEEDKEKFNTRGIFGTHFVIILIMAVFVFFFFKNSPRNLLIKEKYTEAFEVLGYFKSTNANAPQNLNLNSSNEKEFNSIYNNENRINNQIYSNYNAIDNNSFVQQDANGSDNFILNNNNYNNNNLNIQSNNVNSLSREEQAIIILQSKTGINSKLKISFTEIFSKYFFHTTIIMSCITLISNILDDGITAVFAVYIETLSENKSAYAVNFESFKISIFNLVGYLLIGFLLEIKLIGRKINLRINLAFSAIFYFLFTVNPKNFKIWLPLVCISLTSLNAIVSLFVSELYPSKIRDASQGYFVSVINTGGLIGQALFLLLVSKHFNYPFFASLFFIILFFVLLFFLKHETSNKPLDVICDFDAEDARDEGINRQPDALDIRKNLRLENEFGDGKLLDFEKNK